MKRLLVSVAVLGLLAGAPALAQDNDHHHGHDQGQGQGAGGGNPHSNGGAGNPHHDVVPGSNGIFDNAAKRQSQMNGPSISGGAAMQDTGNGRHHHDNGHWQGNGNSNGVMGNATTWQGGNWQGNANTYRHGSSNRWRGNTWHGSNGITITGRNFTAPRRFHVGTYQRPRGWYYRRWSYGDYLPAAFFVSTYWLTDYLAFGLEPPPPGLVWVRYGDDALLVDRYSGEVVQVEYGVFY